MKNIFEEIMKSEDDAVKKEITETHRERKALALEIKDGKRGFVAHPMNWMEHIGPWKGKRINYSGGRTCLVG